MARNVTNFAYTFGRCEIWYIFHTFEMHHI